MFAAQHIQYNKTNSFSKIVLDYLESSQNLQNFYSSAPTLLGIKEAIEKKKLQKVERQILVDVLKDQYKTSDSDETVRKNIELLLSENTFSVCTAHQPNLFTGPLYFIYKILHAIKLSEYLKENFSQYNFVPIFYMGSEDADMDELNHFTVEGKRYTWKTDQKGAVGRMIIDKELVILIEELKNQLSIQPFGEEVIDVIKKCFVVGKRVQEATFNLVQHLFKGFGLVVLIADDARLKRVMLPVFEDDLFNETPSKIVEKTCGELSDNYNVQANPRAVNLFYLNGDIRERIEKSEDHFKVHNTDIVFTKESLNEELKNQPERFSPNVILRGLYQETILPNIAFIGGGGEMAYWLQLKDLFQNYNVPFPVLVLRNSFVIIEKKLNDLVSKLQLNIEQLFMQDIDILNSIIEREGNKPTLNGELNELQNVYDKLNELATSVDVTLNKHVDALKTRAIKDLQNLEIKMLRSERKKMEATERQVKKIKQQLFPNGLQERVENFSSFYAKQGQNFIQQLYFHSLALEQQMTVLYEIEERTD